jgi:hypothetical protein
VPTAFDRQPDTQPGRLPAPEVDEAEGGFLDYEETFSATVRIAAYPGMAANDVVTVRWETFGEHHEEPLRIAGVWVGAVVSVRIPNRCISSSRTVVRYEVERFAGGTAVSEPLILNDRS